MERITSTPNEIIDKRDHCEMVLYSRQCQEVARTLFSKRHLKKVNQHKWCTDNKGYCVGNVKNKHIFLHHFIKGKPPTGLETDHINRNKLDNRDENLRLATHSQNNLNKGLNKNNSSGTSGIYWHKKNRKWYAQIKIRGKNKHLGYTQSKQKSVELRKIAEKKYYFL